MRVFKQIVREFWLQFVISLIWSFWKINFDFSSEKGIENFISNFGACFFLSSWFFGQVIRVKKQQKIESHLDSLTNNLQRLISNLEISAQKIIDNVTGGKSFLYMTIGNINHEKNIGQIIFLHSGDNPVYDVYVEYLDINKPQINGDYHRQGLEIGTKPPKTASSGPIITLDRATGLHYSVFFTTRRGLINQSLRMKFKDGKWYHAIHVSDFDDLQFFDIQKDFPIDDNDTDIKQWKQWEEEFKMKEINEK